MPYKYASVADTATYVHHTGRTALPGAPLDILRGETLLCLHGAGSNQGIFDGLFEALSDRHGVVAFDQPGHGRSGGLDSLGDIETMAKFTRELVSALGLAKPVLLGHSMGGAVAMQYAHAFPDAIRALIVSASAPRFGGSGAIDAAIESTRLVTEGKMRRSFVRELYAPGAPAETMKRGFMEDIKTDPRTQLGDLIACRDWSGAADLELLAVPSLVVRGEHELPQFASACDEIAKRIPGARRVVIPGAGHKLPIEQPAALADAVAGFLEEISR